VRLLTSSNARVVAIRQHRKGQKIVALGSILVNVEVTRNQPEATRGNSPNGASEPAEGPTFRVSDRELEAMILLHFKRDDVRKSVNG
jgi:hypothetical protein